MKIQPIQNISNENNFNRLLTLTAKTSHRLEKYRKSSSLNFTCTNRRSKSSTVETVVNYNSLRKTCGSQTLLESPKRSSQRRTCTGHETDCSIETIFIIFSNKPNRIKEPLH